MAQFDFRIDEKHTIWYQGNLSIEADTYEEAVAKLKDNFTNELKRGEIDISNWGDAPETLESIEPRDNGGNPTVQIYSTDTDELVYENA